MFIITNNERPQTLIQIHAQIKNVIRFYHVLNEGHFYNIIYRLLSINFSHSSIMYVGRYMSCYRGIVRNTTWVL